MIYLVLYRIRITYNSNIVYFMDFRIRYRDLYYLLTILHNMVAKSIRKHSLPGIIENTSGNPGITKNSPGNPGISEKNSENPVFRPPFPSPSNVLKLSFWWIKYKYIVIDLTMVIKMTMTMTIIDKTDSNL